MADTLPKDKKEQVKWLNEFFNKKQKSVHTTSIPFTKIQFATEIGITLQELETLISENKNAEWVDNMDSVITMSFYYYSFANKFTKGVEQYMAKELPINNSDVELNVFVDINDFQKQLQPFNINNELHPEFISIENPRDEIIVIDGDLTLEEAEELVEELDGSEEDL